MAVKKRTYESGQPKRCDYDIEYEGQKQKMVINCKACTQNYSMANPTCINGILNSLSEIYMVDYLYISHYLDTMYFGDSVELLERMKVLMNQIGNYSLRRSEQQFKFHSPKYKKKIPCLTCPINPSRIFSQLKLEFSRDFEIFYNHINPTITEIHKFSPKVDYCNTCRFNSLENLEDIFERFEVLVGFILLSAYKIVYND